MKQLIRFAFLAACATPAIAADTKITTTTHTDASMMMGQEVPAKDSTRTTWVGKDKMRIEEGDTITIVRNDLKKMFFVHTQDKTFSAVDLPIDMKKIMPAEAAPYMEGIAASMKVTVTPTTETKKIKEWNATKYTMTSSMEVMTMPIVITQTMWVTKDVSLAGYTDLNGAMMSMAPGGTSIVAEMKKIDGFPILTEKTMSMMGNDTKSKEEVTVIEAKDAAADAYDVPKDFKERPFDYSSDNPSGGMGGGGRGRGKGGPGRPGGPPPGDKPVDPPKVPPTPPK